MNKYETTKNDLDKFAEINMFKPNRKLRITKHRNHLSTNSKLNCYLFDLPLEICKEFCKYYELDICYVKNNNRENYPSRKNILKDNLKLIKSDKFNQVLKQQILNTKQRIFRFFGSGDFPNYECMLKIFKLCSELPEIKFWIPTSRFDLLEIYFTDKANKLPQNIALRLSNEIPLSDLSDYFKTQCKKWKISYSCTTLNHELVNCHCSLDSLEANCGNCEKCFEPQTNIIYMIHNRRSIKKSKEYLEKRKNTKQNKIKFTNKGNEIK